MVGKTNVAGARLRAVIAVTYPEGSVCTCSNGTKTMKAKDTSGKALFNVAVGEWTVSCTDGSRTRSTQVSITAEGQSKSVTLNYELVLFGNGTDNTSVTGGWAGQDNKVSISSGLLGFAERSDTVGYLGVFTKSAVNVSGYSTLKATVSSATIPTSCVFGLASSFKGYPSPRVSVSGPGTVSVDISSVSSSKYISAYMDGPKTDYMDCALWFSKIWLE